MCGIFGFISSNGRGPEIARLRRLALITQARGEHAFGLAWLDPDGLIQTFKRPGAARIHLDELERCRGALIVVGHCRYATHGTHLDNRNNHPHAAGRGQLVHNGVVYNYAELADRHGLALRTACDSEVLGQLMPRGSGPIAQRAAWVANQAEGDLALLGVWSRPGRLLVVRRGKPLHVGAAREGCYFASLPPGLPAPVRPVADHSASVLVCTPDGLRLERRRLAPAGHGFESALDTYSDVRFHPFAMIAAGSGGSSPVCR